MLASALHSHVIGLTFFVFSIHGRKKHSGQFGTLETSRLATQDGQLKECHPLCSLVKRMAHGNLKTWGEETFHVVSSVAATTSVNQVSLLNNALHVGKLKKWIPGCCLSHVSCISSKGFQSPPKHQVSGEARQIAASQELIRLPFQLLVNGGPGPGWGQHF